MNHTLAILVILAAAAILAAAVAYYCSNRRLTRLLRRHFGPAHDRVLGLERRTHPAGTVLEFRKKA